MSLRYQNKIHASVCWLVMVAIVVQPCPLLAAGLVTSQTKEISTVTPPTRVADVELHSGGVLSGQIVDSAGIGAEGQVVRLTGNRQAWQTVTGKKGHFVMADLSGATYQLESAGKTQLIRAWATGTAPPQASRGVMVLQSTDVVRGQRHVSPNTNQFFRVAKQRLANPWVVGGIVATSVAIPVAIHNADDDAPATP